MDTLPPLATHPPRRRRSDPTLGILAAGLICTVMLGLLTLVVGYRRQGQELERLRASKAEVEADLAELEASYEWLQTRLQERNRAVGRLSAATHLTPAAVGVR